MSDIRKGKNKDKGKCPVTGKSAGSGQWKAGSGQKKIKCIKKQKQTSPFFL